MKLKGNIDKVEYKTLLSAGFDLRSTITVSIPPGEWFAIDTGVFIDEAEEDEYLKIVPRSGLANDYGITVLNSPGTIDADYQHEIKVMLINHSDEYFTVEEGMRIAQAILGKFEVVENINVKNQKRTGGLGSTGRD